jgi:hypothetical protein
MVLERNAPNMRMQSERFRGAAERLCESVTTVASSSPIDVQRIVLAQLYKVSPSDLVSATVSDVEDQRFATKQKSAYDGRAHPGPALPGIHFLEEPSVCFGKHRRDICLVVHAVC